MEKNKWGQKTLWVLSRGWRRTDGLPSSRMAGKFNGLKMKDVKEANKKLKQKNEYAKSGHSKGESPELYNAPIPSAAPNAPAVPGRFQEADA